MCNNLKVIKAPSLQRGQRCSPPVDGEIPPNELQHIGAFGIITPMHPAIFLDRDGVIIENVPSYVRSWDDVRFIPHALEAISMVRTSPYKLVIVTNQSAIGRGIISMQQAWEINRQLVDTIQQASGRIDGIFMCPHAPGDECLCRKPRPGLLLQAAQELDLDLGQSILIGDALSDLQAGQAAGLRQTILVRTGRGEIQKDLPQSLSMKPFKVAADLAEALSFIIRSSSSPNPSVA